MKKEVKKTKVAKQKVAVFDIDGTIFRSSLLIETVTSLNGLTLILTG
jgi:ABC-type microcin C transport system permease subunit YejB